ncbi:hypothetical protein JCM11641_003373 [Rhodosporidiobolus odoratus]
MDDKEQDAKIFSRLEIAWRLAHPKYPEQDEYPDLRKNYAVLTATERMSARDKMTHLRRLLEAERSSENETPIKLAYFEAREAVNEEYVSLSGAPHLPAPRSSCGVH